MDIETKERLLKWFKVRNGWGIASIAVVFFLIFFACFYGENSESDFWSSYVWYIIWLVLICFTFFVFFRLRMKRKRFVQHLEDWSVIVKTVKISKFVQYREHNDRGADHRWYYFIASDDDRSYTSGRYEGAKCFWKDKLGAQTYINLWISFDENNRELMRKELIEKIKFLKVQKWEAWLFDKIKFRKEISDHTDALLDLQQYHIHLNWKNLYYWSEIKVYIDPDDIKTYVLDPYPAWKDDKDCDHMDKNLIEKECEI